VNAEANDFAQFVEAREGALRRSAWLLTGDWGLAEDLVQTALARSWPRWERIRRRDDPEVYVRRVMVNTWMTWSRRRWRGEKASPAVPDAPAAGDVAVEVAMRMALRDALQALTGRQRAVLVLRVYDDLPEARAAPAATPSGSRSRRTGRPPTSPPRTRSPRSAPPPTGPESRSRSAAMPTL
jgi:RNA polymerase sigma-70 factor (ECF subfamily)